ncbi:MAG: dimethylmenaquinone methyltransferase [Anaerolineae bacterium]|nr:ubiquinone/menaquinone biosynthesis methyltransferase [Anaerolineales bacterium]MCQ3971882.1 dimethylmenaquinone methyltransferase [Anaerolineae bacterium]
MTFNSPTEKHHYVNTMFARIAHRYDTMNRIMTGGQDRRWRKLLIQQAQLPPQGKLLDIATGTGDIAFEALRQHPHLEQVVGADFTLPMLREAKRRGGEAMRLPVSSPPRVTLPLSWSGADTLHLPFADNTFDAVASGFLMRNVTSVPLALAEQRRVCKPGGRVLILEIPRPADTWFGRLFRLYFHRVVPFIGGLISGQRDAYAYLPASAEVFLRPNELKAEMEKTGLREVSYTMLMFGTVALHVGVK